MTQTVTLQIPELLYQRLVNTARATNRPLEEVMLHALKVGSPPDWDVCLRVNAGRSVVSIPR